MTPASLFNKVRLAREGAAVERAHTVPHLRPYSVGAHSLDLVTLVTLGWMADHDGDLPAARLLIACAFHDVPERVTGDLPSPIKSLFPAVNRIDEAVLAGLGVLISLSSEEETWLEWGDRLELYLWCLEERARGNLALTQWIAHYEHGTNWDAAPLALRNIVENCKRRGLFRLNYDEIREMTGYSA